MLGLQILVLVISTLGGAAFAFSIKKVKEQNLHMLLSFSGAYLFAIAVIHLIPEAFASAGHGIGGFILIGFILQLVLENFSQGIEHGHIHHAHGNLRVFFTSIVASLSLHAFLEGFPLANSLHVHGEGLTPLLIAIVLHKMPAAFAFCSVLLQSKVNTKLVIGLVVLFSLMTPLGMMTGDFLYPSILNAENFHMLNAIVIGSFLHISTTILFESDDSKQHKLSWGKLSLIAIAFLMAYISA